MEEAMIMRTIKVVLLTLAAPVGLGISVSCSAASLVVTTVTVGLEAGATEVVGLKVGVCVC